MVGGRSYKPSIGKCDPLIVTRVKQYLADNVDKTYVDVTHITNTLKDKYKEYQSRNETAFYNSVEAAYKVVLHSYGLDEDSSSNSDNGSDDLELLEDSNDLNDQLLNMYKTQNKKNENDKKHIENPSELIDILSSDDESVDNPPLKIQEDLSSPEVNVSVPAGKKRKEDDDINGSEYDSSPKRRRIIPNETIPSRRAKKSIASHSNVDDSMMSKVSFEDVGGVDKIMEQICDLILHMRHPEVYKQLGIKTPTGALLHGPPGTGKTLLAHAIAGKLGIPLLAVSATELVGGVSGESEKNIRELFDKAVALESCVLFIDEIDSICGNRANAQKEMEKRIVAQLLSCLDALGDKEANILVLAASNNPDTLDPALRRAGRLEQEIALGIPNLAARKDILRIICRNLNMDENVNLEVIAQYTPGFVGADLQALMNKSCTVAIKRCFKLLKESLANSLDLAISSIVENTDDILENTVENEGNKIVVENGETKENPEPEKATSEIIEVVAVVEESTNEESVTRVPNNVKADVPVPSASPNFLDEVNPFTKEQLAKMSIAQEDILIALKTTKPCAIREGFATVPDITWDDVGSLQEVRRDLQLAVLAPVKYPEQLETLGLTIPSGVLLCGPPGCGKTLIAKAIANEAGINFISVKGPELLNMYVGESERAVRTCFQRARNSAPCVIFFDEFDSLCPRRTNSDLSGATRVVNQLLTEMDGIEGREGVFILAATNRPDIIDPAVLRPGRLDRILYVGMPALSDRADILNAITKRGTKPNLGLDVDLNAIAMATDGYTGADLAGLVRLAATQSLTDFITSTVMGTVLPIPLTVSAEHFQKALHQMRPSVSQKEQLHYEKLRLKYSSQRDEKIDVEMDTTESMDTI